MDNKQMKTSKILDIIAIWKRKEKQQVQNAPWSESFGRPFRAFVWVLTLKRLGYFGHAGKDLGGGGGIIRQ